MDRRGTFGLEGKKNVLVYWEWVESRSDGRYLVPFDAEPAAFRTHSCSLCGLVVVVVVVVVVDVGVGRGS